MPKKVRSTRTEQFGCRYVEVLKKRSLQKNIIQEFLLMLNLRLVDFQRNLYAHGKTSPNVSDRLLQEEGFGTKTPSWKYPFERYIQAGIESNLLHNTTSGLIPRNGHWKTAFEMVKEMQKNFDKLKERL